MLKTTIYEVLMGMTNFVRIGTITEEFIDVRKNKCTRAFMNLSETFGWILLQLVWISLTGGLYLAWIALKIMWKLCRPKHTRRNFNRRRA